MQKLPLIESTEQTRLPTSWYFDEAILQQELELLFKKGPNYVGHESMVPHVGDYHVLGWMGESKSLVRSQEGVHLLGNICRHRQAIILKDRGHVDHLICPLHRWKYDLHGQLVNAPKADHCPDVSLGQNSLQQWNGLLFLGPRQVQEDLARFGMGKYFKLSDYKFQSSVTTRYNFNWKIFIEVYLEDYHVAPFHPGLRQFVNCDHVDWEFGDQYSIQVVAPNHGLKKPGSPVYAKWHDVLMRYRKGVVPEFGAIWMTYYPNIMVELYPDVLVVSTILPDGPEQCINIVEFYYPERVFLEYGDEFFSAQQAAYNETALEDEEICQRMFDGRRELFHQGRDEFGPYLSPYEDGLPHFAKFIRDRLS